MRNKTPSHGLQALPNELPPWLWFCFFPVVEDSRPLLRPPTSSSPNSPRFFIFSPIFPRFPSKSITGLLLVGARLMKKNASVSFAFAPLEWAGQTVSTGDLSCHRQGKSARPRRLVSFRRGTLLFTTPIVPRSVRFRSPPYVLALELTLVNAGRCNPPTFLPVRL